MDRTSFDNQRMIIAVGSFGGGCVLLAEGDGVRERLDEHPCDLFDNCPEETGLYEWRGTYWFVAPGWCGSEPVDADEGFDGVFTKLAIPMPPVVHTTAVNARLTKNITDNLTRIIGECEHLGANDCPPRPHACSKCEILYLANEAMAIVAELESKGEARE